MNNENYFIQDNKNTPVALTDETHKHLCLSSTTISFHRRNIALLSLPYFLPSFSLYFLTSFEGKDQ
ncbi:hypothetical protein Lal_00035459 [Lupinus albus]|nr:hypothetical protein Lal_00035459 [Lupinus albus]